MKDNRILRLSVTALMAALAYVSFTYLKINIPTPAGYTAFHLGNTFTVLAALMLGGLTGGIAGAIGMGIGDVLDPLYITVAPKTIILKTMIGVVTGLFAHKIFKINHLEDGKQLTRAVFISSAMGMLFNCIGEPIFSYFYTAYILGAPAQAAEKLAKFNAVTTCTNAVIAVIVASLLYIAVRKRLKNNDTLKKIAPKY
ncbi:MAG: ECF transporter S component [Solobacterium sp.]|nr:ECF transporter S component [Solobacterium sp.]